MEKFSKEDYLIKKVVPFKPKEVKNIDDLLKLLKHCGFQGRNLGIALDILEQMVTNTNCTTVLTLSGAMVPAGMGELISTLIDLKLIDVLVSTGANIIHDLVDVFAKGGHYLGSSEVNDDDLFNNRINRIYDIFLPEENYTEAERNILNIIRELYDEKLIHTTPSQFLKELGSKITKRCIVSLAAKRNIPIFIPAFSDSELALNLIKYSKREGYDFQFDILKDVEIFADIIKESKLCGTFIIGGGTPRNWSQQVFPLLDQIGEIEEMGYNFSVRIHTATEYDGGLSGCTVSESKTWGKYALESKHVSVWCDATIAFPILVTGLLQRIKLD
jgi:deoxyhypusine synthase